MWPLEMKMGELNERTASKPMQTHLVSIIFIYQIFDSQSNYITIC